MSQATTSRAASALHGVALCWAAAVAIAAAAGPALGDDTGMRPGNPWAFSVNGFYYLPRQDDSFGLLVGQARNDRRAAMMGRPTEEGSAWRRTAE